MKRVVIGVVLGAAVQISEQGTLNLEFLSDYSDERNREWAAHSPIMTLNMVVKGELATLFHAGETYTVTIERNHFDGENS